MSQDVKGKIDEPGSLDSPGKVFVICRYPNTAAVESPATRILRRFNATVNGAVLGTLRAS
jgi:hypothetical protein